MADGDFIDAGQAAPGARWQSFTLLDSATGTSTAAGKWVEVRGYKNFTLDVSGITTATIQLRGSNAKTKPSDTDDGRQVGANVTADGITNFEFSLRWAKAIVSAFTTGTISARINMTAGG